jgi:uncharacterized protein (DUF952 family)
VGRQTEFNKDSARRSVFLLAGLSPWNALRHCCSARKNGYMRHETMSPIRIYKICAAPEWAAAGRVSVYAGSADDRRDGFIHFSTGSQLTETARRYFKDQQDLVLVAFEAAQLGEALRWETSRGGEYFPHLYADLPVAKALWVKPMVLDDAGIPILPEGVF